MNMDPRVSTVQQALHNVQMDVKQVSFVQMNHEERLVRIERRQNEEAVKSAWNSPFPSILGGTPQHGPIDTPLHEPFDDFADEPDQTLLSSLQLEPVDEPVRRGAASRANSVRFDEATLQGGNSNWNQNARHSGDFGPIRPSSGLGMERSFSHKSDGRHSSAGHSIHSVHSLASGRASSLALDDLVLGGRDEDSPLEATTPAPGLLYMGSVPSIVRCWLTTQYAHDTLRYAVVCSGSQKSTIAYALVKALELENLLHRGLDGSVRIRTPIYFAEASIIQQRGRTPSPSRQIPFITADFEVTGKDEDMVDITDVGHSIGIFIGSDTLRTLAADVLMSQNRMTLYGNGDDHERISVPFVRPEDDNMFKHITTVNTMPEKPRLNAAAREFVSGDSRPQTAVPSDAGDTTMATAHDRPMSVVSALTDTDSIKHSSQITPSAILHEEARLAPSTQPANTIAAPDADTVVTTDDSRRDSNGIWRSWRQVTPTTNTAGIIGEAAQRESGLSRYTPAGKGGRNMKILKPIRTVTASGSSNRTNPPPYEVASSLRTHGEARRKSQDVNATLDSAASINLNSASSRWDNARRSASATMNSPSTPSEPALTITDSAKEHKSTTPATRSNPVGGASAFSWMTPGSGPKPLESIANQQKLKSPAGVA